MRGLIPRMPPYPSLWRFVPAALVTQSKAMQFLPACVRAREVRWRGITYTIDSKQGIRMREYEPYEAAKRREATRSIL
jgi:hypothetical protein